jgi:tRNA (guanine-N7-)-methyltransferase
MSNVRVLGGDAQQALRLYIPPASVAAVHVYFPDPWWKKRHKPRRLFTDTFVDLVAAALPPAGLFHVWSDVADYFQVMSALVDHHEQFERLIPPREREPAHDMDYHTSFERKKRKAGLTIHRGLWRRRSERRSEVG